MTALMFVARNGNADCVTLLIEAGADTKMKSSETKDARGNPVKKGKTALEFAQKAQNRVVENILRNPEKVLQDAATEVKTSTFSFVFDSFLPVFAAFGCAEDAARFIFGLTLISIGGRRGGCRSP